MTSTIPPDRDVALLLKAHGAEIERLRTSVPVPSEHNDVWILRFILSAKTDANQAEHNIRETLEYRKSKAVWIEVRLGIKESFSTSECVCMLSIIHASFQAAKKGTHDYPQAEVFKKYVASAQHGLTTDGDLLFIVRAGKPVSKLFVVVYLIVLDCILNTY